MKRFWRDVGVPTSLFLIKILTTTRTAIDTYHVTNDMLDVALIDGVFLAFWLVAAYTGDGKQAMAIRPFAVVGAWILYAAQLYIGWEATHMAVAFVVRVAGGLALLYDTYAYIAAWVQKPRRKVSINERRARQRLAVTNVGYFLFVIAGTPIWWIGSGINVFMDFLRDAGLTIRQASHVTAVDRLNKVDAIDAEVDAGVVQVDSQLTSGLSTDDRRVEVKRQVDANPDVSVTELADALGVSRGTIYNDLSKLGIERNPSQ